RDVRLVRTAQARRRLDQRVEHGLQIEGRAANHLEHVRGRGLLLQRLAQLVEQAGILDGGNSLTSEILHQLNLFVRERLDDRPCEHKYADRPPLSQERDSEAGAKTSAT